MCKRFVILMLLLLPALVHARDGGPIHEQVFTADFETTYRKVHAALENARFWVIAEARISDNLAGFAERWGEDYNRSGLDAVRSLMICNPWYANQVANHDPRMMALCPLSVTIVTKGGTSRVLFARPTVPAAGSPALAVLREAEEAIITAIEGAFAP